MLAHRAICFVDATCVSTGLYILLALISFFFLSFYRFLEDQLSQDPLDQYLRLFHHLIGICSSMIDLDLCFRFLKGRFRGNWQPIFCEIRKMTSIRQAGVPKQIGLWQF